ncbi:MAG: hypothetical protein WCO04_01535 [Pseudomonadota bacterium]
MAKFKEGQTIEIIIEGFFKTYTTPPVPSLKTIIGHDLPKKEQKWNRPHIPSDEEAKDMTKSEKSTIIEREMNRRIYGYWFMNNGVPTYITGDHYFCLTYWFMGALTKDGYPEYRAAAAKWYYVMDMAEKSENCYGLIMSTNKRFGKTEYALSSLYNAATLVDEECLYGMQSLNATEAKNNLFKSRLMRSHKRIPNWIKPVSNESKGTKEIVSELTFMGEKMDGGGYKAGLNNIIDWRPTIPSAYQGKRPRKIFLDEPGSLEEMSLIEWWTTVREQLALGKRIFGKASLPTTMEDMKKKGAIEFVKLWEDSNPEDLDKNGRTKSGLWRYFKPFFLGREGFVDEYGNDLIEEAKQFRQNQLEHADHAAAEKIKRQYPETVEEAFGVVMSGKWEADVKDILKTALAEAEAKDITRYFKISKYDNTIRLQPCKSTDPEAVMIVEDPEPGVKYGGGIDSIGTDNQTGDEGGSKLAFCITKGFGGMGLSYAPICLYEFRPDRLEDAYRVISYIVEYYGATAGPKMFKVMGETNAGATNLLNFLINAGLKSHMAKKPGSLGLTNGKEKTSADKYWLYRTDDVKDYQYLLANRFVRKYGHNIKIPRLLKSLLDLGVVNADAADAFLTSLMLFQDFDEVKKQEQKSTGRWISKWNDDAKQWDWSYIEN